MVFVGADDPRKNEANLLAAYAALPAALRREHPLSLVGSRSPESELRLARTRRGLGLGDGEVVLTGRLGDADLAALYGRTRVVAMPSYGEGLGLPVLEAWAFGTPVVASDRTALPEVMGRADAMVDPDDVPAMAAALSAVLSDDDRWAELRAHLLERRGTFSWDRTAGLLVAAVADRLGPASATTGTATDAKPVTRPRLALVTPWHPQMSGIARHSEVMAGALAAHYDVTVVAPVGSTPLPGYDLQEPAAFLDAAEEYERVLYQIGNSPFHEFQLPLLRQVAGVVVLHDTVLVDWLRHSFEPGSDALRSLAYRENGVRGWRDGTFSGIELVRASLGVLVHSQRAAEQLVAGPALPPDLVGVAPLVDNAAARPDRAQARARLGLSDGDVLVSTFGRVHPVKRTLVVLEALATLTPDRPGLKVAVVGADADDGYLREVRAVAARTGATVTGDLSGAAYADWVAATDVAVQLRAEEHGETSGALVEAMAGGAALVVEDVGTFPELVGDVGVVLPSPPAVADVARAVAALVDDPAGLAARAARTRERADRRHGTAAAAVAYRDVVEGHYRRRDPRPFLDAVLAAPVDDERRAAALRCAAANRRDRAGDRLVVDVTELVVPHDLTGIQRVALALSEQLPDAWPGRVLHGDLGAEGLRETLAVAARSAGTGEPGWPLGRLQARPGDWLLSARFFPDAEERAFVLAAWRATGGRVAHVVHDVLPLTHPQWFPPSAVAYFPRYLDTVLSHSDLVLTVSESTRGELATWAAGEGRPLPRLAPLRLGADLGPAPDRAGAPTRAVGDAEPPVVLMVGTVEPRKGHRQALAAVRALQAAGTDVRLVVVGVPGWGPAALHAELERAASDLPYVEWRRDVDDPGLRQLYDSADLLLAASEGEGFGIPLLEAVHRGLPVLARRLPVFREVLAGSTAGAVGWFDGTAPDQLALALRDALATARDRRPGAPDRSWRGTAEDVVAALCGAGTADQRR